MFIRIEKAKNTLNFYKYARCIMQKWKMESAAVQDYKVSDNSEMWTLYFKS